jgi:hypothetical protein
MDGITIDATVCEDADRKLTSIRDYVTPWSHEGWAAVILRILDTPPEASQP